MRNHRNSLPRARKEDEVDLERSKLTRKLNKKKRDQEVDRTKLNLLSRNLPMVLNANAEDRRKLSFRNLKSLIEKGVSTLTSRIFLLSFINEPTYAHWILF